MGCGCGAKATAKVKGQTNPGQLKDGFEAIFASGAKSRIYPNAVEAQTAVRKAGGGRVRPIKIKE